MQSFVRTAICSSLLLVPTLALAGQGDVAADPQTPAIWNGSETEPCAWPSVVRVTGGGSLCSATLIHPQVVMYAAHCGAQDKVVRFGDSDNTGKTELVEYCKTYPGYNSQGNDWAYCVLQDPVDEIPITPVGYGCEINQYVAHGADIAIVGFGNNSGDSGAGRKRWAFSKMWNPGFSTFNVGGQGYPSVCSGDSGGPAFIRYADGTWHTYGIASTKNSNTCDQAGGTHSLATRAVEWIENDSGIDVTVCHDLEGNWDPGPYCGRFFNGEPQLSYGSWYTWCEDVTESGWSSTCGTDYASLYQEGDSPDITITSPGNGSIYETAPSEIDIEVAVADASGFWDVQIEIAGMLQPVTISDQNPTVFEGVIFPEGEFTVIAHATDFWGNVAVSAPVSFTVSDGPPGGEDESSDSGTTSESGGESESDSGEDESSSEGSFDEVGDTFGQSDEGSTSSCAVVGQGELGEWGLLGLALFGLGLGLRRRD